MSLPEKVIRNLMLVRERKQGLSLKVLSARHGISIHRVGVLLRRHGMVVPRNGGKV